MAEGCVVTANGASDIQVNPEEIIEMITFKSNVETESPRSKRGSKKPEEAIDINLQAGKNLLKILCVGDYSGGWSKGVYIEDYIKETLSGKRDWYRAVIGVDFSLKTLHVKSHVEIRLQIWNIGECERFSNMTEVYYKCSSGAIVFSGATSHSMESAVKWRQNISQTAPTIPVVLVVLNVFKTPAKWIGEGLVMNSTEEMDNFCLEHGFIAWFEMRERGAGEKSVFGQSMSTLVDEIISRNTTSAQSCV